MKNAMKGMRMSAWEICSFWARVAIFSKWFKIPFFLRRNAPAFHTFKMTLYSKTLFLFFVQQFDHLQQPHVPGMPFDFNYAVKDDYYGTDYGHQATSNGDQVRGEYRVQLPDGRLQIVKYIADWKDGYTAEVSYQGEAQYPPAPPSSGGSIGSGSGYPSPIGKPQPSPGYPQPGYPQPSPGYPSFPSSGPTFQPQPSPAYPSPSPAYPVQTGTYQPPKPISSYPKPGSSGSSFGGSQQVPVSTGYPSGIPSSGYPSGLPGGYPSGIPSSGYPSSSPTAGYPVSSKPSSGYGQPSNFAPQNSYGPSQSPISGFGSSQQPTSGYSSPAPSYSSGPDYGGY